MNGLGKFDIRPDTVDVPMVAMSQLESEPVLTMTLQELYSLTNDLFLNWGFKTARYYG